MPASIGTEFDVDVESITLLDFEPVIPCAMEECDLEAEWFLVCGACYVGQETVCQPHRNELGQWPEGASIRFDQTCMHSPYISYCTWRSITA